MKPATANIGETNSDGGDSLRSTGMPLLDLLPWGAHLCLFYETSRDLIEANAGFFRAGLADNEFCFWVLPDQIDRGTAIAGLRERIDGFDDLLSAGAIELVPATEWYRRGTPLDVAHSLGKVTAKLDDALSRGFAGMRASGDAFWMEDNLWETYRDYEDQLAAALAGTRMVIMCTYRLDSSWARDLLDVIRLHELSLVLHDGRWEALGRPRLTPGHGEAGAEVVELKPRHFPGYERLSPRERATLHHVVNGASSKEAARELGLSPRTVEFHRANIMRKLNARNVAELIAIVVGVAPSSAD